MPSTCKKTMKVNTELKVPRRTGRGADTPNTPPDEKNEEAVKETKVAKPKKSTPKKTTPKKPTGKKVAPKKRSSRAKTPEDAIMQSSAVDPDIEKAVVPKPKRQPPNKVVAKTTTKKKPKSTKTRK